MGKLATAMDVFQRDGVPGLLIAFKEQYLDNWAGRQINWCYGKAIEFRGDSIEIDGCRFGLDSPAITTNSKSKFLFGQYERPERRAVANYLNPEVPVVEFGGSIGVVACLANKKLRNPERHVVVEANPSLVDLLKRNRERNQCRFFVVPKMVGYGESHLPFYANPDNFVIGTAVPSGASSGEAHQIQTVTLRAILDEHEFEQCTLICDIEGGESDLLRYESDVLKDRVSTLILEVHEWSLGRARVEELFLELAELGFVQVSAEADTYTFQKRQPAS
jgi:FkbM family methyltransferase